MKKTVVILSLIVALCLVPVAVSAADTPQFDAGVKMSCTSYSASLLVNKMEEAKALLTGSLATETLTVKKQSLARLRSIVCDVRANAEKDATALEAFAADTKEDKDCRAVALICAISYVHQMKHIGNKGPDYAKCYAMAGEAYKLAVSKGNKTNAQIHIARHAKSLKKYKEAISAAETVISMVKVKKSTRRRQARVLIRQVKVIQGKLSEAADEQVKIVKESVKDPVACQKALLELINSDLAAELTDQVYLRLLKYVRSRTASDGEDNLKLLSLVKGEEAKLK